jgi:hypothetical protein
VGSLVLIVALLGQLVPVALAILAVIHIIRNSSERWWILPVLMFPLLGPLAYFLTVGIPGVSGKRSHVWEQLSDRRGARRRIAEGEARLRHAALPAVAADVADDCLTLGQHAAAERHYRVALAALPDRLDIAFGLATSLMAQGRCQEATPLLESVCAKDPRFRFGDARLYLIRCLDDTGQTERTENELREMLRSSNNAEARVRLAALLSRTGRGAEAVSVARVITQDAPTWPRYLRNRNRRWLKLARQLAAGGKVTVPGTATLLKPPRVPVWVIVAVAVCAGLVLLLLAGGLGLFLPRVTR